MVNIWRMHIVIHLILFFSIDLSLSLSIYIYIYLYIYIYTHKAADHAQDTMEHFRPNSAASWQPAIRPLATPAEALAKHVV